GSPLPGVVINYTYTDKRICQLMAQRTSMEIEATEIEATDYFSFPQVTLPTDLSITPRSCDCHALASCRSTESLLRRLLADACFRARKFPLRGGVSYSWR